MLCNDDSDDLDVDLFVICIWCVSAKAANLNGAFFASLSAERKTAITAGESAAPDKGRIGCEDHVMLLQCA